MNEHREQSDYILFREQYELQHPASIPQLEYDVHEYQAWVRIAVLITFICAAAVSGIHTVPTVWQSIEVNEIVTETMRTIVSYASLAAIELAILLSAYLMAKGVKLAYFVMAIASTVAVLANLYSVMRAFNAGGEIGAMIVAIALGIGAPTIALFSGKMFVDIHRADRIQDARAKKVFKETSVQWDKEIEKAWKAYQKNGVGKRRVVTQNVVSHGKSVEISTGNYQRNATEIVHDYLQKNPDAFQRSNRDLASELGVSHPIVGKVKNGLSNGNNHHS
jgi:hypothetical protein